MCSTLPDDHGHSLRSTFFFSPDDNLVFMLEQSKPAPPLDNKMARSSYRLKHRLKVDCVTKTPENRESPTATAYNTRRRRVIHSIQHLLLKPPSCCPRFTLLVKEQQKSLVWKQHHCAFKCGAEWLFRSKAHASAVVQNRNLSCFWQKQHEQLQSSWIARTCHSAHVCHPPASWRSTVS